MRLRFARVVMLGMAAICLTRWAQPLTVVAQEVKSQWVRIPPIVISPSTPS